MTLLIIFFISFAYFFGKVSRKEILLQAPIIPTRLNNLFFLFIKNHVILNFMWILIIILILQDNL